MGLLRNILPVPIADRLLNEPGTIAERHSDVTVLFADIVGFTPWVSRCDAEQVVQVLDEIFRFRASVRGAVEDLGEGEEARIPLEEVSTCQVGDHAVLDGPHTRHHRNMRRQGRGHGGIALAEDDAALRERPRRARLRRHPVVRERPRALVPV